MTISGQSHKAYRRVDVETASQGKLIVMLFDGAIQRAEKARRRLHDQDIPAAHDHLLRAQAILGELRGALDMNAGDIAENLDRVYEYLGHLLVRANIEKSTAPVDECITHLTDMRDTWAQLFHGQGAERNAPQIDPHGSSMMNLQG